MLTKENLMLDAISRKKVLIEVVAVLILCE
jgi:hypothetical protein